MQDLRGEILRLLEEDKEFRYEVAGLIGYREILERLDRHEEKFNEILERLDRHEERFDQLSMRVEVIIGSMGRRWGSDLERMVLEIFRKTLEERGIEPGKVKKFRFRDEDGSVTGVRGRIVDVDVLVIDSALYVIEVKSRAELDHVEYLPEKARFVEMILGRKVDRMVMVAVNIDRDAYERAGELGVDVVCGHVLE